MTRRDAIRALIPSADSALRVGQVVARLPHLDAQTVREAIGQMHREGVLARTGNRSDGFSYYVCRPVKVKAYATDEERKAAKKRTDAAHNRRRRLLTMAQRRLGWELAREMKRAEREARKEDAERERERKRAAKREAERKVQTARTAEKRAARADLQRTRAQRLLSHAPARPALPSRTEPSRPAVRVESVEDWMRRTGQAPERLPAAWDREIAA